MEKQTVEDFDVVGKTVLLRVDYNVPFEPNTIKISDDSRIDASLQTICYLLDRDCKVVVCSHLGRPKGRVVEELRMRPLARRLSELLERPVTEAPDCIGAEVEDVVGSLPRPHA